MEADPHCRIKEACPSFCEATYSCFLKYYSEEKKELNWDWNKIDTTKLIIDTGADRADMMLATVHFVLLKGWASITLFNL